MVTFTVSLAAAGLAASTYLVGAGSVAEPPAEVADLTATTCVAVSTGDAHLVDDRRCVPRAEELAGQ